MTPKGTLYYLGKSFWCLVSIAIVYNLTIGAGAFQKLNNKTSVFEIVLGLVVMIGLFRNAWYFFHMAGAPNGFVSLDNFDFYRREAIATISDLIMLVAKISAIENQQSDGEFKKIPDAITARPEMQRAANWLTADAEAAKTSGLPEIPINIKFVLEKQDKKDGHK